MSITVWAVAVAIYALFWLWYVGPRKRISPEEADKIVEVFDKSTHSHTSAQIKALRDFFADDDGRDFVMVNLIHLRKPVKESSKMLAKYQNIFLGALIRKAGHPVLIAKRSGGNLELVNCEENNDWAAAGMIRYRSRRDLMEILPGTLGSEHHKLKLDSLEKTIAYPSSDWFMLGGPRIVVALIVALAACIAQLIILI
ncbi:MAG: hypothetical protein ACI9SK_000977 [Zhongshania sp.]|jgi:hypothetical protein